MLWGVFCRFFFLIVLALVEFGLIWLLRLKWSVSEKVVDVGSGILCGGLCAISFGFY